MSEHKPLISIQNLKTYFTLRSDALFTKPRIVYAVDDISFDIGAGETVGLVGESGCGKTTVGRTILRLEQATGGKVLFNSDDVFSLPEAPLRHLRQKMQIVFQDPFGSLNPRMTIGNIIGEPLIVHGRCRKKDLYVPVSEIMDKCGLDLSMYNRFPHEFSGGQRQRVGIARALILGPEFVILDEPVSALDVSVQAQIINLLIDLQKEFGFSFLFIAHDLAVVRQVSRRVVVMYLGKIMELAMRDDIYDRPLHPYTISLHNAVPRIDDVDKPRERIILQGDIPSSAAPPSGCRFRTRCYRATERCAQEMPALREVRTGHFSACHYAEELDTH